MPAPLLQTKLHLPAIRPEQVARPRLFERLNAGLFRKLTLISAPAGFGKTTLASAWLRSGDRPFVWVSLDEGDNDPSRFLIYLVSALQRIDGKIGETAQLRLEAPKPPPVEALLTELINDVATQPASFVLVLDDYQTITAPAVHEALSFLLERQPPEMHLVVISRQDPPLPISRLRGRGQVTEIRQSDLRFTFEETTAFLDESVRLSLSASQTASLEALTEGWITGLQMAALALKPLLVDEGSGGVSRFIARFSGRHHFVLDYLTDEVLRRQPDPVREFLRRTSILKRMCGSLCDALIGHAARDRSAFASSQQILEHLQRANLFVVPLDDERLWFRYHRLFSELLRARLQEEEPEQVPRLHLRAATWCDQNGLPAEAVDHALAIPDLDLAADIIERGILKASAWSSVNVAMFLEWLSALPDDVVRHRPRLRLFASRVLYLAGQREETEQILQDLEDLLHDNPSFPDDGGLLGRVILDRASYAAVRGDVRLAIELAGQALTCFPEDEAMPRMRVSSVLGLAHFRSGDMAAASQAFSRAIVSAEAADLGSVAVPLVCNLAEVQIVQGQLRQAFQTCQRAMDAATVDGARTSAAGFAGLELSKILYEQNNLEMAERRASESLGLLIRSGTTDSFGIGHALLARIRQAQGEDRAALAAIREAIGIAQGFGIARVSNLIAAHRARIWLAQGGLDLAARWAADYGQMEDTEYLREFEDLTLSRVLLAQDSAPEALVLLDTLLPPAEVAGRMGTVIEILTLRALAVQATNDTAQALGNLERALKLARPEGYARVFIDEGQPMRDLLRRAAKRGIEPGYVGLLLAAGWPEKEKGQPATGMSALVEPLSDREIQVLGLLADRLTNSEIAQRLVISLPTVKSHTSNIYGKLGVHSRKDAVIQAIALGILPSG